MKRREVVDAREPYWLNPEIYVYYELDFNNDKIKPGDKLKFKRRQGTFQFRFVGHNAELDKTWIDCIDVTTGEFRAFYVEYLKSVIRPKKSRRKKIGTD